MDLWALSDLATPWCVLVACTLRIADHVSAGKCDIAEIAAAASVDRDSLQRVLRHLVSRGVFEEPEPGQFKLNDTARQLLEPAVRVGFDLNGFGGRMAHAWGTLLSAVRSGKPAYHERFGRNFWEDLEAHPAIAAEFDALMGPAGHGAPDPDVLLNPAGWDSIRTVADIGGGTGSLLAEILRAHAHVRGILVDLARTVTKSDDVFKKAGVANRVTAIGQSFFDPLPAGADVYLLKSVLSDWPDEEARMILERCAAAARPGGRVVIVNGVTPDEIASPELMMLVLVGGKERTLREFRKLAHEAGLEVRAAARNASGRFLVECVPA
jgi:SAM-dependent methyltransferase